MYCRWHGLALRQSGDQTWSPYRAHDDGVLIWVGLPSDGEVATDRPAHPARPPLSESVSAVIAKPGVCEPEDVIANRLDPWHGPWFHPYAFSHLVVDDDASDDQVLVVNVTFRLSRTWGVPVRAEFSCPDSRTIVMRITAGERGEVWWRHMPPRSVLAPTADRAPWSPKPPLRTRIAPAFRSRAGCRPSCGPEFGVPLGNSGWTTSRTRNAATSCANAGSFLAELCASGGDAVMGPRGDASASEQSRDHGQRHYIFPIYIPDLT
jgi:hypothetical protein